MPPPRPNLSGFDMRKYRAAAGQPANDPWKRHEAWRYTGPFTRFQRFRGVFPGFGIALVAFTGYCAVEWAFFNEDKAHHGEGHH